MRVLLAIALIVFGFVGFRAARAADIPAHQSGFPSGGYYAPGERAGMLLVYDDQPGVFVRAYWRAPWRDHHYFPATGMRPKIGRDENLHAHGVALRPAKTFKRDWSNGAALERALEAEQPIFLTPPPAAQPAPMPMPPQTLKP